MLFKNRSEVKVITNSDLFPNFPSNPLNVNDQLSISSKNVF